MKIDYYCALVSPWTYMGHARLGALAAKAGAEINIKPVDALSVFNQTGGLPLPKRSPERQAYRFQELARWKARLGIDLTIRPAHFPADETQAALLVTAAREMGLDAFDLAGRFMRACWAEERNIGDPETVAAIVSEAGMDPAALTAEAERIDAAALRDEAGREAIAAGVFGVPFYILGEDKFWGQDRMSFVAERLGVSE